MIEDLAQGQASVGQLQARPERLRYIVDAVAAEEQMTGMLGQHGLHCGHCGRAARQGWAGLHPLADLVHQQLGEQQSDIRMAVRVGVAHGQEELSRRLPLLPAALHRTGRGRVGQAEAILERPVVLQGRSVQRQQGQPADRDQGHLGHA